MKNFGDPAASAIAALLWIVLAWRSPTSTYHFAPLVVTLAWPWTSRSEGGTRTTANVWVPIIGGTILSLMAGGVLLVAGRLEGPTLWSESGQSAQVVLEILLVTAIGAGISIVIRGRRGEEAPQRDNR